MFLLVEIGGEFKTYYNLMATFIVGGIWHGAGWTFVFWGFLHGLGLVIHRAWSKLGFKLWTWLAWLITFNFINIAWVFFRAKEWDDAIKVLGSMFSLDNIVLPVIFTKKLAFLNQYGIEFNDFYVNLQVGRSLVVWLIVGFIMTLMFSNSIHKLNKFKLNLFNLYFVVLLFFYSAYSMIGLNSEFLYFNF